MAVFAAPKLSVLRAKPLMALIREMKDKHLDISTVVDYRPDGEGDEVRARFFSIYSLENAGGKTDRIVAHFNRDVNYPSILKVDSQGRLAVDTDTALQRFDMRGISITDAYAAHPDFKPHPILEFDDLAFVQRIDLGNKSAVAKTALKGDDKQPTVEIDI